MAIIVVQEHKNERTATISINTEGIIRTNPRVEIVIKTRRAMSFVVITCLVG